MPLSARGRLQLHWVALISKVLASSPWKFLRVATTGPTTTAGAGVPSKVFGDKLEVLFIWCVHV